MKHYDFAFSCGFACGVTQALREADLQFASFPFDWTASPGFRACAQLMAGDFSHWLDRDDLELVDIRRGGINKHCYKNRRTGFGFVHDFSSFNTFGENYPMVTAKYARRIARLKECLTTAKKVLAVYVEWPILSRISDAELDETRRILSERHPDVAFDLLYFYCEPGAREPRVIRDAGGVTVVANDYRTFADGELNHQIDNSALVAYLRANVAVADPRTDAERSAYAADWLKQDKLRWHGRNFFETFVNRTAFRCYRKLERFLVRKRLVPPERPLWFVERGHRADDFGGAVDSFGKENA